MTKAATHEMSDASEEAPRLSDVERRDLLATLERARGDIAAGDFDVVTPASMKAEYDGIRSGKTDEELDADLTAISSS